MKNVKIKKVVLAYSGGLDTSIIIPWLKENFGCEVLAMAADVGQGEELEGLREKAIATGASKVFVEDLREEFVTGYIWPTLRAGAVYESKYLLGTSFARPVIAKRQVAIALREGADAVAHGCTGKGNDQVRFELTYKALAPELAVIAPWRQWSIRSREDAIEYARARNVPVSVSKTKIYSRDRNLWHVSHEGGRLESLANAAEEPMWLMTRSPREAPDRPARVKIGFEKGAPVSVNGEALPPVKLIETLNAIGGENAVGRIDLVENRLVGIKSRGCYETPGGTLLYTAHRELESLCLDRETLHQKEALAIRYAELVYYGQWFTPLREALDAFVSETQRTVTGEVTLELYKGNTTVLKRSSPWSLYREDLSSFTMGAGYDQKDAEGFINCLGLPIKVKAILDEGHKAKTARPRKKDSADDVGWTVRAAAGA
ncbi:MAG: argininosuccinate synthase [Deltaproteobacteria bacterium]|nr:argininosuccinate synthase [Deltaproteobacteria bacterium]